MEWVPGSVTRFSQWGSPIAVLGSPTGSAKSSPNQPLVG